MNKCALYHIANVVFGPPIGLTKHVGSLGCVCSSGDGSWPGRAASELHLSVVASWLGQLSGQAGNVKWDAL